MKTKIESCILNVKKSAMNYFELAKILKNYNSNDNLSKYNEYIKKINNVLSIKDVCEMDEIIIQKNACYFLPLYFDYIGDYMTSYDIICKMFNESLKDQFFMYIVANNLHLRCKYNEAIAILSIIINDSSSVIYKKAKTLLGHCYKHLGLFDNSLDVFYSDTNYDCARLISIYYLIYLTFLLKEKRSDYSLLEKALALYNDIDEPSSRNRIYLAAIEATLNKKIDYAENIIDRCISEFLITDDRYIYNAYFIKAEILRLKFKYNEAYDYYLLSSGINNNHKDINLYIENYFFIKYLELMNFVNKNASKKIEKLIAEFDVNIDDMRFDSLLLDTIKTKNIDELSKILFDNVFIIL